MLCLPFLPSSPDSCRDFAAGSGRREADRVSKLQPEARADTYGTSSFHFRRNSFGSLAPGGWGLSRKRVRSATKLA
jgi:hypothetical protein